MSYELAQRIFGTPHAMALAVLAMLTVFLLAAAWCDMRRQRIPNALVFSGALLALLLHTLLPAGDGFLAGLPGGLGFWSALAGLACGLLALLPLYLLRAMGAGDVKLLAMTGAFLGPVQIWGALFATVLAGGALALLVALRQGVLRSVLGNVRLMLWMFTLKASGMGAALPEVAATVGTAARLPYGVAIAAGSIAYLVFHVRLSGLL